MSLRKTIAILLGVSYAVLIGSLCFFSGTIFAGSLDDIEREQMLTSLERASAAVGAESRGMLGQVLDWAHWDASYAFMDPARPPDAPEARAYVDSNLCAQCLRNIDLDLLLFFNADGELRHGVYLPPGADRFAPLPKGAEGMLREHPRLRDPRAVGDEFHGLLRVGGAVHLVAGARIVRNDDTGLSRGWLVMARRIDPLIVAGLSERTGLSLRLVDPRREPVPNWMIRQAPPAPVPGDPAGPTAGLDSGPNPAVPAAPVVFARGDLLFGAAPLRDLDDAPVLVAAVDQARNVAAIGRRASSMFLGLVAFVGLLLGLLTLSVLRRRIPDRVEMLAEQVARVRAGAREPHPVHLDGRDELASLAAEIDAMVGELRDNEAFVLGVLETMSVGALVLDVELRTVVNANAAACEILGVPLGGLLGKPCAEICGRPSRFCPTLDLGREEIGRRAELHRLDGGVVPVLRSVRQVFLRGRGRLLETFVDLREQEAVRSALETSEERYRSLFENIGTATAMTDERGAVHLANNEFLRLLMLRPEALESGVRWADICHPDDLDGLLSFWRQLRDQPETAPRGHETRLLTSLGDRRHVSLTAALIPGSADHVVSLIDVTERKRVEAELAHRMLTDPVTGLPNRVLLSDRITRAIAAAGRSGSPLAVFSIDLDRFKNVNDTWGYSAGDTVLTEVGQRLRDALRREDTVGRVGSDEFLVIASGMDDPEAVSRVADKLIDAMRAPLVTALGEVHIGLTIGAALYPEHAQDAENLLRKAALAMQHAKESGTNVFVPYASGLDAIASRRAVLENRLRAALERDEFEVHYQPKVHLADGAIRSMEALVRWRQPDGALLEPGEFMATAESSGLVVPMDLIVLRKACLQTVEWLNLGLGPLRVSTNLSTLHFRQDGIVGQVRDILSETGLPPHLLELEITESTLMENFARASDALRQLQFMGVSLALDDFGKGYSSLSALRELPIRTIKIDRSFVAAADVHPGTNKMLTGILSMIQSLGLDAVAEGVETPEQFQLLRDRNCPTAQGFLFSKPVPPDVFAELLPYLRLPETVE